MYIVYRIAICAVHLRNVLCAYRELKLRDFLHSIRLLQSDIFVANCATDAKSSSKLGAK